ncbi:MAG TPA: hypothetical protein VJR30_01585 [Bradyrhizobium sp.]|nr:hypothetical protein [Bradyrhizobium sp.]
MFTFETADQKEVRRFRIAQFNGRAATFRSNGSTVTGIVRSIVENKALNSPVWIVTLIPSPPRAVMPRPAPRLRAFAEDRY